MRAMVTLNSAAAGAYLADGSRSQALMAANAAAIMAHMDIAREQRDVSNQINYAMLEGQQAQSEQLARFAHTIEQTMGYVAAGIEALYSQGEQQTDIMARQLSSLANLGDQLDHQTELLINANRFAGKQSETKAAEIFGKGLKCITALNHLANDDREEMVDRAIEYFGAAIEEDEFNEQAQLQAAIWKCFRNPQDESWPKHYRKTKAIALTELRNGDSAQVEIARQTIEALAAAAPIDMVKNGQSELYLDEFADFCLENASDHDRDNVQILTCAAMALVNRAFAELKELAQEVARCRGWPFVLDSLLQVHGVAHSGRFLELLDFVCGEMDRSERECADAAREAFQ